MKTSVLHAVLAMSLLFWTAASLAGDSVLDENLQPLAPFVDRTWQGSMVLPEGPPMFDVSRWETTLGGKAIRIVHSLNQGVYGGETIVFWDQSQQSLAFYYFTTKGFYTHGTLTPTPEGFDSLEFVENSQEGITQVRAATRVLSDGRMHIKSEYLQNGEWVAGREFYYVEEPDAKVIFQKP